MENIYGGHTCPFALISWTWYAVSVVLVFILGALWYSKLFRKQWLKAANIKCNCGAYLGKDEVCSCERKPQSILPMLMQLLATCFIGLMYFLLTHYSVGLSLIVLVAISAWMKASLRFQILDYKQFFILAGINVGYFFLTSIIFILFALI